MLQHFAIGGKGGDPPHAADAGIDGLELMQLQLQGIGQAAVQRYTLDIRTQGGNSLIQGLSGNGEDILLLPYVGGFYDILGGVAGTAGHFYMGGPAKYTNAVKAHAAQHRREQQDKHRTAAATDLLFTGGLGSHGLWFSFLWFILPSGKYPRPDGAGLEQNRHSRVRCGR